MPVYIIAAGETDMVKIGWALRDVEQRCRFLQCAHYEKLRVLRVLEGASVLERWMHRRFRGQWVRNEWFRLVPEMLTISADELRPPPRQSTPGLRVTTEPARVLKDGQLPKREIEALIEIARRQESGPAQPYWLAPALPRRKLFLFGGFVERERTLLHYGEVSSMAHHRGWSAASFDGAISMTPPAPRCPCPRPLPEALCVALCERRDTAVLIVPPPKSLDCGS